MNRIEEAIQKAKVAKAVRERDAERAAAAQGGAAPAPGTPPTGATETTPLEAGAPASAPAAAATPPHVAAATQPHVSSAAPPHVAAATSPRAAAVTPVPEERARSARVEPFPRAPLTQVARGSGAEAAARGAPQPPSQAAPGSQASHPEASAPPATSTPVHADPVVIDAGELERAGLWPDAEHARRLGDEFRVAKRAVLSQFARMRGPAAARRVVAVSSALAGEGKSFSSLHLAISLALERGLHVLLVDGDGARPTLTRALGCAAGPGLLDCLERAVPVEEALRPTSIERLWFLPAGTAEQGATELLTSPQMAQVLDRAGTRLRDLVIVVDTPPLLLTVEARALVDAATQTLLVVKANSTPQAAILQALDQFGEDRPVQLLLNQRHPSRLDAYQYYYTYPATTHASEPH